jgi:Protein of unknown function (DUF2628)
MKVFTVHEPPEGPGDSLDRIIFVKEGFCWPALVIPTFWLLWQRMWLVLLAWLAIGVGVGLLGEYVEGLDFIVGVFSLLFAFWFALEANALRRWSLARKGWRLLGVAAGRDREEAEQSYFRRHMAEALRPGSRPGPRPAPLVSPFAQPPRPAGPSNPPGHEPVIGLFPQPE